jgi:hypothetical protein
MEPWEPGKRRSLVKVDRGFLCWAWFYLNFHHKSLKFIQCHSWLTQCQQVAFFNLDWEHYVRGKAQVFKWSNYICPADVPLSVKSNSSSTSQVFLYIMVGHFVHLLSSEFQLVVCLYCFQIHTEGLSDFALKQNHGQGCAVWKLNSWSPMMWMPNSDLRY